MSGASRQRFGAAGGDVSVVGQGTWKMEGKAADAAVAALQRGLDLGLNHIDTAEMYGAGESERIVGKAIAGRRSQAFLVSKVLPTNASRRGTVAACEASLQRLGVDYLDCYLLHWRGNHPLADTIAGFEQLQRDGKIKSWGVSNFDADDLAEVRAIAGVGHPVCNQVLYHLGERAIEHQVVPWCRAHDCAVVAYTPFGQTPGIYADKAGGRVLNEIARAHAATPRQVALAFLLRESQTFVIPKASDTTHIDENAAAAQLRLSSEDISRIDTAFPRGKPPRSLPMI